MPKSTAVDEPLPTARPRPARTVPVDAAKALELRSRSSEQIRTPLAGLSAEALLDRLHQAYDLLYHWVDLAGDAR